MGSVRGEGWQCCFEGITFQLSLLLASHLCLVRKPSRLLGNVCTGIFHTLATQHATHYCTVSSRMELIKLICHGAVCRLEV